MPHQCLACSSTYDNTSDAIIKGCPSCGGKLFLFVKKLPEEKEEIELSEEKKELLIKELETHVNFDDFDAPVILKLENIRILAPGKYELDINQLMKKEKPLVYRIQEGTYVIDLNFKR
jgi:hypothetical protein